MRQSTLSIARLALLSGLSTGLSAAEFGAQMRSAPSRPAPSRRRSTRSPWSPLPYHRARGRTGPAAVDLSTAGRARIAAAEGKRVRRRVRNTQQALRGGWGADAQWLARVSLGV